VSEALQRATLRATCRAHQHLRGLRPREDEGERVALGLEEAAAAPLPQRKIGVGALSQAQQQRALLRRLAAGRHAPPRDAALRAVSARAR
jgi:hypothetical protein